MPYIIQAIYIYIYIYIHTHTHTHTHLYIFFCTFFWNCLKPMVSRHVRLLMNRSTHFFTCPDGLKHAFQALPSTIHLKLAFAWLYRCVCVCVCEVGEKWQRLCSQAAVAIQHRSVQKGNNSLSKNAKGFDSSDCPLWELLLTLYILPEPVSISAFAAFRWNVTDLELHKENKKPK